MTSSAEPLIQSLQRVSNRFLRTNATEAELVYPLLREDLRLSAMEQTVGAAEGVSTDDQLIELFEQTLPGGE